MKTRSSDASVLVYTMGKVGSSTISTSLEAAGVGCFDVHFLETERLTKMLRKYLNDPDIKKTPPHIIASIRARDYIESQSSVKMISLVRNPIMRNISAVFQNTPKRLDGDIEAIMARLRNYATRIPDDWFQKDFKPITGIDVLSADIDSKADHFRFSKGKFEVLLLKLEADDVRKSDLIGEFLGKKVKLKRANEAQNKWYRDIYRQAIEAPGDIRQDYIEECVNLKYFKKLYSEAERRRFLELAAPETVAGG